MPERGIYRGAAAKGFATPTNAPIRIDSSTNTPKYIPAGSGTTEIALIDASAAQTLSNKTLTAPVINKTPIVAAAATLALAAATHDNAVVVLNRATGVAVTLPAASGSGASFCLFNGLALSGGSHTIAVANASDYMRGAAFTATDNGAGAGLTWPTTNTGTVATESDTVTWNGTTQGGIVGSVIELTDIAANVWSVQIFECSSGTEATPFSAAV